MLFRSIHRFAPASAGLIARLLGLLLVLATALPLHLPTVAGQRVAHPPNVVLILLDDADARIVAGMPNVSSLLTREGTSFTNFFVSTPLCCPSRASILRGQYSHNHGVRRNNGEGGGFETFYALDRERSTLATWLQDAGYRTGLFGKYLNRYPTTAPAAYVPPGWSDWRAFASKGSHYYVDYVLNENGRLVTFGDRPRHYSTDVLANDALNFVDRGTAADTPFFLYFAPYAPHGPAIPAPRDADAPVDNRAPRPPSFNEADIRDKPRWIRTLPRLKAAERRTIDERHRQRQRSLLAVDDAIGRLVDKLRQTGELDNTYIIFTSDNGFHLGEHRLPDGKQSPYEESIRMPLVVRGPGVPAGREVAALALNSDLAPTIADLAGVAPPDFVDGRSLAPLLRGEDAGGERTAVLIEYERSRSADAEATDTGWRPIGALGNEIQAPSYDALRTTDHLYVEYASGERELYDLGADPFQLENLAATADPDDLAPLAARLAELRGCAADACRAAEDAPLDAPTSASARDPASARQAGGDSTEDRRAETKGRRAATKADRR